MVREVIHVQVGQCGNQVGCKFWESIASEHGLASDGTYVGDDKVQLEKIDVFYHETPSGQFVPRGVLVDTENSVLNHITSRVYGKMFRPENFLSTSEGAANNFMTGCYHPSSVKLANQVYEVLRKEIEKTECTQGITYSHSTSGGTGSGLTSNISKRVSELLLPSRGGDYFFTVFPSTQISNTVIEPYNSVLTLNSLKSVDNVVCFDNEALYNICFKTLQIKSPTFGDINRLIATVMTGTTASFRFPGQINTDLNKLSYSLRCRSFLHFYIPSYAPLFAPKNQKYQTLNVSELVKQMAAEESMMVQTKPNEKDAQKRLIENPQNPLNGKCFAHAALFRGPMTTESVDEALTFLRGGKSLETNLRTTVGYEDRKNLLLEELRDNEKFFLNNPRPMFNSITSYPPPGIPMSVTYIRNTTQIKHKFLEIIRQAMKMNLTGCYSHWYDLEKYSQVDKSNSLENVLGDMSTDWIAEFGVEDQSEYPEAQDADEIAGLMSGAN